MNQQALLLLKSNRPDDGAVCTKSNPIREQAAGQQGIVNPAVLLLTAKVSRSRTTTEKAGENN